MSTDRASVRLVIIFLGLVSLVALGGGLWLSHDGKTIPPELIAMGSAALGGITGLLAHTGRDIGEVIPPPPEPLGGVPAQRLEAMLPAPTYQPPAAPVAPAPAADDWLPAVPVEPAPGA